VKKPKLNFRFHDPNTAETVADYILKLFIDANLEKIEAAIRTTAEPLAALHDPDAAESHSV
jgi:hypothetical protein